MEPLIFALATPTGGALAIIRISGAGAHELIERVFTGTREPQRISYGRIVDNGETLDTVTAVCFYAPHSYTGEDMAEIYCHGGQANVSALLKLLSRYARTAEPGEFTKRAFLNGKLDLSQAEAVMDVISAESALAVKNAVSQLEGSVSKRIHGIESVLMDALSGINAAIDYPEELEDDVFSMLPETLNAALHEISVLIEHTCVNLRTGASVVIAGRPNAGKSSLLNALLGRERAIVTPYAGTTRDIIEEKTEFMSMPVRITDTAGLRSASDAVEKIGVERARTAVENADMLLLAFDGKEPLNPEDIRLLSDTAGRMRIAVICKSDVKTVVSVDNFVDIPVISVSSVTGEGIDELKKTAASMLFVNAEDAVITNSRHAEALTQARECVKSAMAQIEPDCIATDIRDALVQLGAITGSDVDGEVIERIFSRFCVGK